MHIQKIGRIMDSMVNDKERHERGIAEVLSFWFEELSPAQWFKKDDVLDETIRLRFGSLYEELAASGGSEWLDTPRGPLAAVIVLDQFPRNLFREDARAYATDAAALTIAKSAIDRGFDRNMDVSQKQFLYMPFQHCEDLEEQIRSVGLFASLGDPNTLNYARRHKDVIEHFGRFPHRNAVLGRSSTPEELEFLEQPNSSF